MSAAIITLAAINTILLLSACIFPLFEVMGLIAAFVAYYAKRPIAALRALAFSKRMGVLMPRVLVISAVPFLCTLPFGLANDLVAGERVSAILRAIWGVLFWREFKNRKNKKRRAQKILARVRDLGGRLVVEPIGVKA